ncbi:MAG TPA: polysaccharide deacetylase family protein [Anaeromyxobacteraceae bacterium]
MLASLSIDLDALGHYHRIHGLGPRPEGGDPVYGKAVERFGELCDRLGVRGTAFCVGEDLARPGAAVALRRLAEAGHELGNHSLSHDYALSRRSPPEIAAEVRGGAEAIRAVAGAAPVGFRAPGYTLSPPLVAALVEQGYRYDSSTFPALPYWLGKAAVMGALALTGQPSQAILDRPRVLLAPRRPYHPHPAQPYARGPVPLLELPVATGLLGFPLTGTFVATFPAWSLGILRAGTGRRPLFALELHGLDLLDASDASPALAARQRDLRVPASVKIERLVRFARALGGREWVTLAQAAERLAA